MISPGACFTSYLRYRVDRPIKVGVGSNLTSQGKAQVVFGSIYPAQTSMESSSRAPLERFHLLPDRHGGIYIRPAVWLEHTFLVPFWEFQLESQKVPRLGDMCMMRLGLGLEGMIAAHVKGPPDASGLDAGKEKWLTPKYKPSNWWFPFRGRNQPHFCCGFLQGDWAHSHPY